MKKKFGLLILLGVIGLTFFSSPAIYACTPPPQMPWFTEIWEARSSILPPEILVENNKKGYIQITNSSSYVVYLVPGDSDLSRRYPTDSSLKGLPLPLQPIPAHYSGTLNDLYPFTPGLRDYNEHDSERPVNITLPAPQESWFTILSQGKRFDVPVRLAYELYPDYQYIPFNGCNYGGLDFIPSLLSPFGMACCFLLIPISIFALLFAVRKTPNTATGQ
jgi:hypothetical protein